jgi:hypothetical protein
MSSVTFNNGGSKRANLDYDWHDLWWCSVCLDPDEDADHSFSLMDDDSTLASIDFNKSGNVELSGFTTTEILSSWDTSKTYAANLQVRFDCGGGGKIKGSVNGKEVSDESSGVTDGATRLDGNGIDALEVDSSGGAKWSDPAVNYGDGDPVWDGGEKQDYQTACTYPPAYGGSHHLPLSGFEAQILGDTDFGTGEGGISIEPPQAALASDGTFFLSNATSATPTVTAFCTTALTDHDNFANNGSVWSGSDPNEKYYYEVQQDTSDYLGDPYKEVSEESNLTGDLNVLIRHVERTYTEVVDEELQTYQQDVEEVVINGDIVAYEEWSTKPDLAMTDYGAYFIADDTDEIYYRRAEDDGEKDPREY